jgi:hypothetical protein
MRGPPQLPDLTKLTSAQKDELIVDLWETLRAIESTTAVFPDLSVSKAPGIENPRSRPSTQELRARLAAAAPSRREPSSVDGADRHKARLEFLASKPVLLTIALIGLSFLADCSIGWYQRRLAATRERAALELRNAAFSGLYIELVRVAYEPDGKSYRATLAMQNTNPAAPLYVLLDPARVFVQTGMTWQALSSNASTEASGRVAKLDSRKEYSFVFQAGLKDWAELVPGYMHIRIQSDMLISQSNEPKDDIVARNNRFYVYLKPQGSDDAAIKKHNSFSGNPPVFIPMPPH